MSSLVSSVAPGLSIAASLYLFIVLIESRETEREREREREREKSLCQIMYDSNLILSLSVGLFVALKTRLKNLAWSEAVIKNTF